MSTWALWVGCLVLLLVRSLIACGESALHGISDLRAKELSLANPRRGKRVLRLKTERESAAASIRLGITLSGFLCAAIGALAPPKLLDLARFGDDGRLEIATALVGALFVGFLASLSDVTFRSMANGNPEGWALRLSGLINTLVFVFTPLLRAVVGLLNIIVAPFGTRVRFEAPPPPLEELEKLLTAEAQRNTLDRDAPALIRSIFEMSDKKCRDVMVPRTEVVGVEINAPAEEILRLLAEENHSRIPVYRDDIDHIVGVLHARDLIPLLQHPELIVVRDIIRPANFVPWVKPIADLLREMQRKKIHMAMVVDEHGGFMGIVTLEDILREIVGDIGDEFEVETKYVEKQADGSFLVDATMHVTDFGKTFGLTVPEGDYETLAGYLSSLAGSIPEVGERFGVHGWQFIVHEKAGPRLERVRVVKPKAGGPPSTATREPPKEKRGQAN
jgi:putative hemolysin